MSLILFLALHFQFLSSRLRFFYTYIWKGGGVDCHLGSKIQNLMQSKSNMIFRLFHDVDEMMNVQAPFSLEIKKMP